LLLLLVYRFVYFYNFDLNKEYFDSLCYIHNSIQGYLEEFYYLIMPNADMRDKNSFYNLIFYKIKIIKFYKMFIFLDWGFMPNPYPKIIKVVVIYLTRFNIK